ncbi:MULTISPECIES: L-prolyl-[peptidyl-carrier protein] dehydrogenase [unclassified Streptomyces]|uniref:L-prolyl-[peptidyl-carrier protein] dehydrogenase n=1 Tax=unclassified Streptomyces TaxID=2593676 RepID=UPI000A659E95|nr:MULTISPECIES: L-prolyl-[peptidyl-carrier protein] dehydrogenase [unclassified Streptomyces]
MNSIPDLDFDPQTRDMRDMVLRFARRELPATDGFDPDGFRRRWEAAGKQGLVGSSVPVAYGGSGLGAVEAAAMMEALGEGSQDTGFAFSVAAHLFAAVMPLVEFGTEQQKNRWLPPLCSGELIAAHGITEPGAGSDALSLETRARRDGDHYVLSGEKCFTTNAPVADLFVVQAATRDGGGFFGLTTFLVPASAPGLTVGRPYDKVGLRGSPMADVRFTDCPVPAANMLGSEGAGAVVFSTSMKWERTCLFGIYLGGMRRTLDSTLRHVREREQFGTAIGGFQAVSHRVVDMLARYETARLMLYRAARGIDTGSEDGIGPALAKLVVSEAAVQLGLDAIQLRGALGILDGEAESLLRDALPARIFSGTNEIQKNNIARELGLGERRRARRR